MGWKGAIRSMNAAANRARRENQKRTNQLLREQATLEKKITKLRDKRAKVLDALDDLLAKGKIDATKYASLKERQGKVMDDVLVFGGAAGLTAAKRFMTGDIEEEEFKKIAQAVIPQEVGEEKEQFLRLLSQQKKDLQSFVGAITDRSDGQCHRCHKKKGFFCPLRSVQDFSLCKKCFHLYKNLKDVPDRQGMYFFVRGCDLSGEEPVVIGIKTEHL